MSEEKLYKIYWPENNYDPKYYEQFWYIGYEFTIDQLHKEIIKNIKQIYFVDGHICLGYYCEDHEFMENGMTIKKFSEHTFYTNTVSFKNDLLEVSNIKNFTHFVVHLKSFNPTTYKK